MKKNFTKRYLTVFLITLLTCAILAVAALSIPSGRHIERILSYRKMTAASVIAFAALLAAIAYFLLTNASARSIVFRF